MPKSETEKILKLAENLQESLKDFLENDYTSKQIYKFIAFIRSLEQEIVLLKLKLQEQKDLVKKLKAEIKVLKRNSDLKQKHLDNKDTVIQNLVFQRNNLREALKALVGDERISGDLLEQFKKLKENKTVLDKQEKEKEKKEKEQKQEKKTPMIDVPKFGEKKTEPKIKTVNSRTEEGGTEIKVSASPYKTEPDLPVQENKTETKKKQAIKNSRYEPNKNETVKELRTETIPKDATHKRDGIYYKIGSHNFTFRYDEFLKQWHKVNLEIGLDNHERI